MRTPLAILVLALLTGCGGSSAPTPAPALPQKAARRTQHKSLAGDQIGVIKEAIQRFQIDLRRSPKDLTELVKLGYLAELPPAPEGQTYYYNPELANVGFGPLLPQADASKTAK